MVTWVVAQTPLKVTSNDLKILRNLQTDDGEPIERNYRDPQNLESRTVFNVVIDNSGKLFPRERFLTLEKTRSKISVMAQQVLLF